MKKSYFNVNVRKKGDTWAYQITIKDANGRWVYHSSKQGFKSEVQAKNEGNYAATAIKPMVPESEYSFRRIADLYIYHKDREESTLNAYRTWLKNFEPIHDKRIVDISYMDVAEIINAYYATHKYTGTKSLLNFGKAIMNFAIEKLDVDIKNPFSKVTIEKKTSKLEAHHSILTESEIKDLVRKLKDPEIQLLTALMGFAGLRIGEARAISRNSVDFKHNELIINKQRQRVGDQILTKENTKSVNSKRTVPLPRALEELLSDFPVPLNENEPYIQTFLSSTKLKPAYEKLGFMVRPHTLRHSYATILLQKGVDPKTAANLLGDRVETVMKVYAHVNDDMMERAKNIIRSLEF